MFLGIMGNCLGVCTAGDGDTSAKNVPSKNVPPSSPVPTCTDSVDCLGTTPVGNNTGLTVATDSSPYSPSLVSGPTSADLSYEENVLSPDDLRHTTAAATITAASVEENADIAPIIDEDNADISPILDENMNTEEGVEEGEEGGEGEEEGEGVEREEKGVERDEEGADEGEEGGEEGEGAEEGVEEGEEGKEGTELCPNFEIDHHQLTRISYRAKVDWWYAEIASGNR